MKGFYKKPKIKTEKIKMVLLFANKFDFNEPSLLAGCADCGCGGNPPCCGWGTDCYCIGSLGNQYCAH